MKAESLDQVAQACLASGEGLSDYITIYISDYSDYITICLMTWWKFMEEEKDSHMVTQEAKGAERPRLLFLYLFVYFIYLFILGLLYNNVLFRVLTRVP